MKLHMPKPFITTAFLCLLACTSLKAQETAGIQISALTAAERDSISLQLRNQPGLRMVYACVPVGIIVFSSNVQGISRAAVRSQALNTIAQMIAPGRIGPAELNPQAAEAACQSARGE